MPVIVWLELTTQAIKHHKGAAGDVMKNSVVFNPRACLLHQTVNQPLILKYRVNSEKKLTLKSGQWRQFLFSATRGCVMKPLHVFRGCSPCEKSYGGLSPS